jgi:hypothetical protein
MNHDVYTQDSSSSAYYLHCYYYKIYTSKKTHYGSITKTDAWILFTEMITEYSENHMKLITTMTSTLYTAFNAKHRWYVE